MGVLDRLAQSGYARAVVSEITRDPDPAPTHAYQADPHSGAGNCVCGMAERHRRHPHEFMGADSDPSRCTCALPADAQCHRRPAATPTAEAKKVHRHSRKAAECVHNGNDCCVDCCEPGGVFETPTASSVDDKAGEGK